MDLAEAVTQLLLLLETAFQAGASDDAAMAAALRRIRSSSELVQVRNLMRSN